MQNILHTEEIQTKYKTGKMEIPQKGCYKSLSLACKNMSTLNACFPYFWRKYVKYRNKILLSGINSVFCLNFCNSSGFWNIE